MSWSNSTCLIKLDVVACDPSWYNEYVPTHALLYVLKPVFVTSTNCRSMYQSISNHIHTHTPESSPQYVHNVVVCVFEKFASVYSTAVVIVVRTSYKTCNGVLWRVCINVNVVVLLATYLHDTVSVSGQHRCARCSWTHDYKDIDAGMHAVRSL